MNPSGIIASLFLLAVTFGVATMLLKDPTGTNSLIASSTATITGVTKALEGR